MSAELVERARRGDVPAFEALVGPRVERMVRTATAILGSEADARDAAQEALVAIWRELPTLRNAALFAAWSDRILVNRCRLALRRRRRRSVREIVLSFDDPPGMPAGGGHDDMVARREWLERAFERLDPETRALIVFHHLDQMPLADIADRLGIPVGTAKSRLHHARQRLDRALEADR